MFGVSVWSLIFVVIVFGQEIALAYPARMTSESKVVFCLAQREVEKGGGETNIGLCRKGRFSAHRWFYG